jgi:hypothetical protein
MCDRGFLNMYIYIYTYIYIVKNPKWWWHVHCGHQ